MIRRDVMMLALLPLIAGCGRGGGGDGGETGTVLGAAREARLTRFLAAVEGTELAATLAAYGPWTLFVPSNRAFAAARLPDDPEAMTALLAYHVVPGAYTIGYLDGVDVNYVTLEGSRLRIDGTGAVPRVGGAAIVTADLEAANGVVHVIDMVLRPG